MGFTEVFDYIILCIRCGNNYIWSGRIDKTEAFSYFGL